jgi:hypothetical protein
VVLQAAVCSRCVGGLKGVWGAPCRGAPRANTGRRLLLLLLWLLLLLLRQRLLWLLLLWVVLQAAVCRGLGDNTRGWGGWAASWGTPWTNTGARLLLLLLVLLLLVLLLLLLLLLVRIVLHAAV